MFNLHHIDIWINNVEESINFYNKLGFIKFNDFKLEEKGIILMKKDDIILEMKYHYDNICEHNNPNCKDNKILGFQVKDIFNAKDYIIKEKLTVEEIIIKKGILDSRYFIISDPNGNNIEFIEN